MARREDGNRAFAEILREWNATGAQGDTPMPVERLLGGLVAPLAREAPILLLVLDGLSFAVWRVLAQTIGRFGWSELVQAPATSRLARRCGGLAYGDGSITREPALRGSDPGRSEQRSGPGFAVHSRLVAASRAGHPPRLFHKADLGAGPELGTEVSDAVATTHSNASSASFTTLWMPSFLGATNSI